MSWRFYSSPSSLSDGHPQHSLIGPAVSNSRTIAFSDLTSLQNNTSSGQFKANRSSTDDEPLFGIERNISRRELEEKIRSKKSSWAFGVPLATDNPTSVNTSSNSFETYQQEHKKWFGERRRGVPVNNYDIDWDQMRRKLELQEISSWYKLKEQRGRTPKFDRTQLRKYWSVVDRNMNITEITTVATTTITVTSPPLTVRPIVWYDKTYIPEFKKYMTRPFFKNYIYEGSLEKKDQHLDGYEPPFGRVDKTGKTLFGRLYREPRKRHYHVQDDRDSIFAARDLRKFVNRTYDADFRIGTHRRTLWQNRTFDPNYIFTQHISWQNFSRRSFVLHDFGRKQFERLNSSIVITPITTVNRSQISDPDFDSYMNLLQSHQVMSHKMKHHENRTVGTDNSFIPQRSSKVPWNNDTDPELYKAYRMARKRFYNKTLDIAFSYYIFNKYRSGNLTRDVGYGRMSNVVNRWYNRTFQPKYRPDMFYLHNRGKFGKEFNYHRNELHSDISGGKLDPERWHRVVSISNRSTAPREFQVIKDITEDLEILPREKVSVTLQTEKAEIETTPFELLTTTTVRRNEWYRTTTKVPAFPTSKSAKSSFFQSVKEKGLGFFKTFFTRQDSDESEEE
ncbi:hypothetical protein J6590_016138 [Homalodisca vitripennis]|nr:hypothetical protein J6590_016138 [Homalodisca vitripennis]